MSALASPQGRAGAAPGARLNQRAPNHDEATMQLGMIGLRFTSRHRAEFANRILSAMRHEFGGHLEKASAKGKE